MCHRAASRDWESRYEREIQISYAKILYLSYYKGRVVPAVTFNFISQSKYIIMEIQQLWVAFDLFLE